MLLKARIWESQISHIKQAGMMILDCVKCGSSEHDYNMQLFSDGHYCFFCVKRENKLSVNDVYNEDIHSGIKKINSCSIDLIITDPPYECAFNSKNERLSQIRGNSKKEIYKEYIGNSESNQLLDYRSLSSEFFRILKKDSHCYIFTGTKEIVKWSIEMQKAGFKLFNLIIWKKNNSTFDITFGRRYNENKEMILFFVKGSKKLSKANNKHYPSCFEIDEISNHKFHPAEKPHELIRMLLELSSKKGDLVFDGFGGSGQTFISCIILERDFIGFELSGEYYKRIKERINTEKSQIKLKVFL